MNSLNIPRWKVFNFRLSAGKSIHINKINFEDIKANKIRFMSDDREVFKDFTPTTK